ncbi:Powdery mildew resistance protein, RPW8 domain [Sesbania bispinosa]|nr:Powdery mildew resistance protein, RPW8 domain [Sesbania bispinosa]
MADLLSGGAVGALMGEALKYALEIVKSGLEFNSTLERNTKTLNSLGPLVEQMKRYNEVLNRPREEIERLESHIRAGQEVVNENKKLSRWKILSFPARQRKLRRKDEGLKRHLSMNVPAENKRDLMEILSSVRLILEILLKQENFGQYLGTQIRGLSGAPDELECMGMDEPLNKLKIEVLKDGVSFLVLTGLGGSGKSTLAKKLCWDPQVKGKFGGNIFFLTISETPNLKNIVKTLFEYCGCDKVSEFQSDEDATNRLGPLLRQVGRNPIFNIGLLRILQQSLDMLGDKFSINEKECFTDLGLFPEDQRILVSSLIDMWAELHKLDEDGRNAMTIIHDLTTRNLINVIVTRNVAMDTDMYYNYHFVILHDLLKDLAIHQNKGEPFEQRKRLIIDLKGDNRPEWWVGQNQQGIIGHIFSFISRMLVKQEQLRVAARILSISTDETFTSDWCDMQPDEAEVLVLNIHSSQYSLPDFTDKMSKLKVLIVTNYGFHRSKLNKFELLGFLSNLKRIRLEKVSVPCLCILENLRKLSLHMCNTKQAFEGDSIQISKAMPNLVEMSIDYCNDLVKLPNDLCNITPLKKLSITNCHKLHALPQEITKLENLEVLGLCSCSGLVEMPDSIGGLNKLHCFDISDCVNLLKLPEDNGELQNLKKLYMNGCSSLSDLPYSVTNLKHKIHVICDEERVALCEHLPTNFKIEMPKVDINLNWLHGVRS